MWEKQLLKDYFKQILESEDIRTQWNSSVLINTYKDCQDKVKLGNKRSISLTRKLASLFEKIVTDRLNNHIYFIEATREKALTNLVATKSVIKQRMTQNQETMLPIVI